LIHFYKRVKRAERGLVINVGETLLEAVTL